MKISWRGAACDYSKNWLHWRLRSTNSSTRLEAQIQMCCLWQDGRKQDV